ECFERAWFQPSISLPLTPQPAYIQLLAHAMTRLRFWFLLPARLWFIVLFFAPLAIICAYSLLTRGVYGGVERPWTFENYRRMIDPLYGAILLRSILLSALATAICVVLAFPL